MKLIDKDRVVAELERRIADNKKDIERAAHSFYKPNNLEDYFEGYEDALVLFKEKFLDTIEVKEVDLENMAVAEWDNYVRKIDGEPDNAYMLIERNQYINLAKHFFELGLSINNPITASDRGTVEEIIFALNTLSKEKMISYDKEIEWLRNQVKEGE